MLRLLVALLVVASVPAASAGSRDAPEVADAADDCAYAPGNEYADIVAAWISDETAMDFLVNVQLSGWLEQAGGYAGYTIQFTHQGVQWGVVAFFDTVNGGWEWNTGYIDVATGQMRDFNQTQGAFDASTATMAIVFPKALFPHGSDDNKLTAFVGGSADLKKDVPLFVAAELGAPVEPAGGMLICDLIEGSAEYTFTTGQHTSRAPELDASSTATPTPEAEPTEEPAGIERSASDGKNTPFPPLPAILLLLACLAAAKRTR